MPSSPDARSMRIEFTLNGKPITTDIAPMERLLDTLRYTLGLTGSKEGCGEGECGACTVLIDGEPVVSCLVPFAQVEGRAVQSIEGVEVGPVHRAFMDEVGAQCGICTPGIIMAAMSLPTDPSRKQMQEALAGNLCRCTGYEAIFRAIRAAKRRAVAAP